jgi:nicotinate-nucleotide adenylyltransferase
MKFGFFGGSFDPIHFGHLNLAIRLAEIHQLDRVFFSPASLSPDKKETPPGATAQQRLAMVELAIQSLPHFVLWEGELRNEGLSYTIDALLQLQQTHPHDQFHLLLGEDLLSRLFEWKESDRLLEIAPPLIGTRSLSQSYVLNESIRKGLTQVPLLDITSTEIRERIKKRLNCQCLVPANVLDYINANKLYSYRYEK